MNKQNNTSTGKPTTQKVANHTNFIEALKNAGTDIARDTVSGFKNDLLVGGVQQMTDTIFNSSPNQSQSNGQESQQFEEDFDFVEFMRSQEKESAHQRVQQEYNQTETVIFNRRQAEIERKIDDIRMELQKIAREIVHLDQSTEAVIQQEVVDPGTYHLNFFDKLMKFMVQLRKRIVESRHWFAMQNQRSKSKSYFWQQSNDKVSGTRFSQSQERQIATQTG